MLKKLFGFFFHGGGGTEGRRAPFVLLLLLLWSVVAIVVVSCVSQFRLGHQYGSGWVRPGSGQVAFTILTHTYTTHINKSRPGAQGGQHLTNQFAHASHPFPFICDKPWSSSSTTSRTKKKKQIENRGAADFLYRSYLCFGTKGARCRSGHSAWIVCPALSPTCF